MKDIKSYVIGFLTCACLFLIMGQKGYEHRKYDNQIGRYQFHGKALLVIDTIDGSTYDPDGKQGWNKMNGPIPK